MTTKIRSENPETPSEEKWAHIGESQGCADHHHDLIHELSRTLDALWRYDQFIANADGRPALQACWRDFKKQETASIAQLKKIMKAEVAAEGF